MSGVSAGVGWDNAAEMGLPAGQWLHLGRYHIGVLRATEDQGSIRADLGLKRGLAARWRRAWRKAGQIGA